MQLNALSVQNIGHNLCNTMIDNRERLVSMQEIILELVHAATNYLNSHSAVGKSLWETVLYSPGFTTFFGAILGVFTTILSTKMLNSQKNKAVVAEKYEVQLKEFYNPLIFLLEKTTAIYKLFNIDEKKKNPNVKTLDLLLDGHSFSNEDNQFLEEIIENNKAISKLISEHSGYVDEAFLAPLVELVEHYDLIERAYKKELPPRDEYRQHTYPRNITETIKKRRDEISKIIERNR